MEFNEKLEDLNEVNREINEKTEPVKNLAEDFFERFEHEKIKVGEEGNSKAISFGRTDEVKDSMEKYEKAMEEYNYRLELLNKSINKGEKSFNESIDAKYAKRAVERAEIDLKYAKKNNS